MKYKKNNCPIVDCSLQAGLGLFKLVLYLTEQCSYGIHWVNISKLQWLNQSPGRVAQSVTCLATDESLTADPGIASSIPARLHTFMEIDLRSFSSLPLNHLRRVVVSYKRMYVHEVLVNCFFKPAQEKSVFRWTDRPAMTIAVDLGRKATKQTKT